MRGDSFFQRVIEAANYVFSPLFGRLMRLVMTAASAVGSTGLATCIWKPALRARHRREISARRSPPLAHSTNQAVAVFTWHSQVGYHHIGPLPGWRCSDKLIGFSGGTGGDHVRAVLLKHYFKQFARITSDASRASPAPTNTTTAQAGDPSSAASCLSASDKIPAIRVSSPKKL
jgi:hypothetical protein